MQRYLLIVNGVYPNQFVGSSDTIDDAKYCRSKLINKIPHLEEYVEIIDNKDNRRKRSEYDEPDTNIAKIFQ